jgi:hypothetical protein
MPHAIYPLPGSAVVRFEPLWEGPQGARLLALRVLQVVEPIKYAIATDGGDGTTGLGGSLLRHPKTGKVLTISTGYERYRDLGLL